MNPIQKAIADISFTIPREVLEIIFSNQYRAYGYATNPMDEVRDKVIYGRVIQDCNLVGGTQVRVYLGQLTPTYTENRSLLYRVPKSLTQNRSIVSILAVEYGVMTNDAQNSSSLIGPFASSQMSTPATPIMDATMGLYLRSVAPTLIQTTNVHIRGENIIEITDTITQPVACVLRCMVENDAEMSNLKPRAILAFTKLCVLAVQAHIYNNRIKIGQGALSGGQELSIVRDIVDSYSDANEMYNTYLSETWSKVAIFSDPISDMNRVRRIVGSGT